MSITDIMSEVLRSFYCCFMGKLIKHVTAGQDISCKSCEARDRSSSQVLKSFYISVLLRIITEASGERDKAVIKVTESVVNIETTTLLRSDT